MTIQTYLFRVLTLVVIVAGILASAQGAEKARKNAPNFDATAAVKRCGPIAFVKRHHLGSQFGVGTIYCWRVYKAGGMSENDKATFKSKSDPNYLAILKAIQAGKKALDDNPRVDMPGARPAGYPTDFGGLYTGFSGP